MKVNAQKRVDGVAAEGSCKKDERWNYEAHCLPCTTLGHQGLLGTSWDRGKDRVTRQSFQRSFRH